MNFKIRPGRYTVPHWGKVDTAMEIPDTKMLELYEHKGFPFIEPVLDKKFITFLKKQKVNDKRLASLIMMAKSAEEVNHLLQVSTSDPLKKIAATKIKSLERTQ
ncbi:MAG: hypothetical protein WBG90_05040 [Saonia sp.]